MDRLVEVEGALDGDAVCELLLTMGIKSSEESSLNDVGAECIDKSFFGAVAALSNDNKKFLWYSVNLHCAIL